MVSERQLIKNGNPVDLGGRALDVLIALTSRPNEVLSKHDLMAEVWPNVIVGENSLRFHIALLRKAIGDGKEGARYIATIAGRGYSFVAAITSERTELNATVTHGTVFRGAALLPARLVRMVGRNDSVLTISAELTTWRFVTIVGAGGVGKTTLAVAAAHHLLETFVGSVLFLDLGMLTDPGMVAPSLASTLGISIRSDDPVPSIIQYLRNKRILLVFDNCEHVIEAAATLSAEIFRATSQVYLLATSRETLRADGEFVYKLEPFDVPTEGAPVTMGIVLTFSAAQLFVERAAARGARLDLRDADAPLIAAICRKLDGVALAIELAAGRVGALGLRQTAELLDQRLTLWQGQRTAPPRQKTLLATLEWSYGLLSEMEKKVLRSVGIFVGHFTMPAVEAVAGSAASDQLLVIETVESLVAKSMIVADAVGETVRYRLLSTTRSYVLGLDAGKVEYMDRARRHAIFCRSWLERTEAAWPTLSNAVERAPYLAGLGDVRTALEWCFGNDGDTELGISLATAAVPVFLAMFLLTECRHWAGNALTALSEAMHGGFEELHLQAALGLSSMFTRGSSSEAYTSLARSLAIAEERGDTLNQIQLLAPLAMYHMRVGEFKAVTAIGERALDLSTAVAEPGALALAHLISGIARTHTGDLAAARTELEAAQARTAIARTSSGIHLGFDGHDLAGLFLARTLWLQGYPDRARALAHQTIDGAVAAEHPVTLLITLVWAISLFVWMGDLEVAEELLGQFVARADAHSLSPYLAVGRGYRGLLAIRRNAADVGVPAVSDAIAELHATRYELHTTTLNIALVQGLAALGRFTESLALVDEAICSVEASGDTGHMPELLRIKAAVLLSMSEPRRAEGEACLMQSLDWCRRQGALMLELRASADIAKLWGAQGRPDARTFLRAVYVRFEEGFDTPDLRSTERLLATLP
ncbi:ATP-binding protein [Labrys sp. ZIDIC5]|uniref:ATP-binding protein n=1 Tax=Labrys sedimenti TaxID=3106036 RepID=UPI002ACAC171|nr:winged helix-turn-helix domain-containing protein [Labrys sp. ZIDIC5]MDZ5454420.1 winged helix-turn-helix domain-containing protein [Labrys sp. ZIDIC5]